MRTSKREPVRVRGRHKAGAKVESNVDYAKHTSPINLLTLDTKLSMNSIMLLSTFKLSERSTKGFDQPNPALQVLRETDGPRVHRHRA